MAKKVLSIVIGTECTKVCEVSYKKNYKNKGIKVYRSISFPTPPDTIEDGFIKDKTAFGEVLKSELREGKLKSDKVIFSVASSKIANREVIIPPVKEKRIMDIITTGASEYFPIELNEYILSYLILEKNTSNRKFKSLKKKQSKEEKKLAKKLEKEKRKALKKKSKTEIIAENMEMMEAQENEKTSNPNDIVNNDKDKGTGNAQKQMRLSVFAAPSTLVKNYYSFAKMMHLDIVAIDYIGNSSYQTIKRQVNRGTNVFVQMNEQDTLISILRDDVLLLQRTVGYGVSALTETVMEQNYFKINNAKEAFELLKERNLLSLEAEVKEPIRFDSSWTEGESAAASEYVNSIGLSKRRNRESDLEVIRNIRDSLHFLANSIARMLDYYKSNHKQIDIEEIYITGQGVNILGIDDFFTAEIGIPHKKMEKLYTVSSKKKAKTYRSNPSAFISCIGAVIKPVDFIPREFILKKQKRSAVIGTILFSLVCLAGASGIIYVSYIDYRDAKEVLQDIQAQYDVLPPLSGVHEELNAANAELGELTKLKDMTQSNNDYIKEIIDELERKLPSGTVIHTMVFQNTAVTMNVTANDDSAGPNALVYKTLKQLKTIKYFKENIDVSGISVSVENGISKVNFTITCKYVD
ncbi:pilus assembly protein PilM [Mobilitalea sibirica]|uniref:Pilus assembly protein PilM n=1 Tax=Mobilitalea sibirica TaxID=1462919 RepID=A0A8J7HBZ6_9FIRM|nr:pilus assembly protein PilM [Mobilitalea sibirica]MBH1939784.1 pilus assembly protein PilM [Mobilitalea sibirica]